MSGENKNLDNPVLVEGEDYYVEDGFMIFTAHYLLNRGYCCEHGCRHCPYGYAGPKRDERGGDVAVDD